MQQVIWKAGKLCDNYVTNGCAFRRTSHMYFAMTARRKMKMLFPGSFFAFFVLPFTLEGTIKIFYNETGVRGKGIP